MFKRKPRIVKFFSAALAASLLGGCASSCFSLGDGSSGGLKCSGYYAGIAVLAPFALVAHGIGSLEDSADKRKTWERVQANDPLRNQEKIT